MAATPHEDVLVRRLIARQLAGLDRTRSAESWTRRAYEAVRHAGPTEGLEERITEYLRGRIKAATEREAAAIRFQVSRRVGVVPEDLLAPGRVRIASEGGISHEHAVELGYESVADLLGHRST